MKDAEVDNLTKEKLEVIMQNFFDESRQTNGLIDENKVIF